MNPSEAAKSIFLKATEKMSPAERQAYLDEACGTNAELRQRVEALLKAHEEPDSFLDAPAVSANADASQTLAMPPVSEGPGTIIGPYKLLQQIGEGGMGIVYLAEQDEPVRRRVALKIIKPGMDSRQVIGRFEAERQALAMMEHQNIARVLEAGTTGTGRPFFVMELVKGIPITEYCDKNKLTPRERLALFIPVCQAIQHAHQKGIIHRDVKPSNVLVCLYDGKAVPKVIDFGVAKATEQRLTEKTMFTQHGQIIGTLEYMSPEQAELSQLDVDTRSDIYSLGVLLYELLTGSTPITKQQVREASFIEMLRLIREGELDKPSTRLSQSGDALPTISAQRRVEPRKLALALRGELDWIVMKALEKDRTRRYATANDLARDIERHLNDEPVEACPPSAWYQFKKVALRHRATMAIAGWCALVLVLATVLTMNWAIKASTAEQAALVSKSRAEAAEVDARRQRDLAVRSERQAKAERDRAVEAEEIARQQRNRALDVTEDALQGLGRTLYQTARAQLASDEPGRRWTALQALRGAAELRQVSRQELEQPREVSRDALDQGQTGDTDATQSDDWAAGLALGGDLERLEQLTGTQPSQAQLRSEAVEALLLNDGRIAQSWDGHIHAISPGGRLVGNIWISYEQRDGGCRIFDALTGESVWERSGQRLAGVNLAIAPSGKQIALVALDFGSINLIEIPSGNTLRVLTLPPMVPQGGEPTGQLGAMMAMPARLRSLLFSGDGRWLTASRSQAADSEILLWDLDDAQQTEGRVVGAVAQNPLAMASFSPDSQMLAWRSDERSITLRSLDEAGELRVIELPLLLDNPISFVPQTSQVVVHGHDLEEADQNQPTRPGTILVWDVEADREAWRYKTEPTFMAFVSAVSPDGRRIAVGDMTGELFVVDVRGRSHFRLDHGAMPQGLEWSPDGERLLSAGLGACLAWEMTNSTAVEVHPLADVQQSSGAIANFAISPDQEIIAVELTGSENLLLYDFTAGRRLRTLPVGQDSFPSSGRLLFSPDGNQLLRFGFTALTIWEMENDFQSRRIAADVFQGRNISSAGFREDRTILLGGIERAIPTVKEAKSGDVLWQGGRGWGAMVQLSQDASLLVTHAERTDEHARSIEIRNVSSGELLRRVPSLATGFSFQTLLDISPDNRWLLELDLNTPISTMATWSPINDRFMASVISGTDQTWKAAIWNIATGERQCNIEGQSKPGGFSFSPDGRYFVVSQRNGQVTLWNVETNQRLFTWQVWHRIHDAGATRWLAFTPDSRSLVIADASAPQLRALNLVRLNEQLAELGLGW